MIPGVQGQSPELKAFVWRCAPAEELLMDTEDAAKSQAGKKILKGKDYFSYH